ncbi:EamA family transporter [Clostridium perfringens]|uniref:DMT family transporter n=1 Tax=Clostridium perfringens TaxID=1502 RepID=UPI0013E2EB13|nr:EamA family transporter [Clostridium perfringens]NGU52453.1 EamA family transporter [Clostridium perfringens]
MNNKQKGISLVLIATVFWGIMGISSRILYEAGLSTMFIAFSRSFLSSICFFIWIMITDRKILKIDPRGLAISALYGIGTFALCFIGYNLSVEYIPISVATVLMFTNSIWVTIFGVLFFGEKFNMKKGSVILLTLVGCIMVSNMSLGHFNMSAIGIAAGLGTGFLFAFQIIFPKFFSGYRKDTLLIYGYIFASIFIGLFTDFKESFNIIANAPNIGMVILNILSIGILSTFISNTCYIKSTEYIEASVTSILASMEPVLSSIFAFFIFGEVLNGKQIVGAILIIIAAIILELKLDKERINNVFKLKFINQN